MGWRRRIEQVGPLMDRIGTRRSRVMRCWRPDLANEVKTAPGFDPDLQGIEVGLAPESCALS